MLFRTKKTEMPQADDALAGRELTMPVVDTHVVLGNPMMAPWPDGYAHAVFGMGCFWGAERRFWTVPGVWTTAVGYAGGFTPNPTYEEVCSGRTGHNEVVLVVWDPDVVTLDDLLRVFWENHDPTTGMRQGNDIGTQYRSGLYLTGPDQIELAEASRTVYQGELDRAGLEPISTEIVELGSFFYAEDNHQQYLAKVTNGYDCHANTGIAYPGVVLA